jgi:formylglycine-generating enzyme required for sulfatase activity
MNHDVGARLPNAFGLLDMLGNVSEWCADGFAEYDRAATTDPTGPTKAQYKVNRGGSHEDSSTACSYITRSSKAPDTSAATIGFRPCRTLP